MAHLQNRSSLHTSQVLQKSHQANARQNRHGMTTKQTTEKKGEGITSPIRKQGFRAS